MREKKGAIEVQFNWIFILIIGAIILLFFFSIVRTQKTVSEKKISGTVRRDIRAIFTGAGVSTGTASLIDVPKMEIEYDCEGYAIQKTSPIKPLVSFSPDSIIDIKLMLWALDWNIGFRVTNFLYITSPNIRYILVYEDADQQQHKLVDKLNETLPSKYIDEDEDRKTLMNKEIVKNSRLISLEDKNNQKIKFIFFNRNSADIESAQISVKNMEDEDITAVNLIPDPGRCGTTLDCYGTAEFYTKEGLIFENKGSSSYIKLSSFMGAVFADKETYDCNMENAFKRLSLVAEIYLNKTKTLQQYYTDTLNFPCSTIMSQIETILIQIRSEAQSFETADIANLYSNIQSLEEYNDRAIKLSCAELY